MRNIFKALFLLPALFAGSMLFSMEAHYGFPGITAQKDGAWVGSDHLLGLPDGIPLDIVITKSDNVDIQLPEAKIQEIAEKAFKDAGIELTAKVEPGKPPLPFFQILIIIYKIPEGYAFSLSGRLFEAVDITRAKLNPSVTMQAITWTSDSIHVASTKKVEEEMLSSVQDLMKAFIEKYKFFKDMKKR